MISDIVLNTCNSVEFRSRAANWQSRTHFPWKRVVFTYLVLSQRSQTCQRWQTRAKSHIRLGFPIVTLQDFIPSPATRAQAVTVSDEPGIESNVHICKYIRRTFVEGVRREYLRRSLQAKQNAVENGFSHPFITGFTEVKGALKTAPNTFFKMILTDMIERGLLNEVSDRSIACWT